MPFDERLRTRVLLWCDRHCCLCKKACGVNIEVDHIVPESESGSEAGRRDLEAGVHQGTVRRARSTEAAAVEARSGTRVTKAPLIHFANGGHSFLFVAAQLRDV